MPSTVYTNSKERRNQLNKMRKVIKSYLNASAIAREMNMPPQTLLKKLNPELTHEFTDAEFEKLKQVLAKIERQMKEAISSGMALRALNDK